MASLDIRLTIVSLTVALLFVATSITAPVEEGQMDDVDPRTAMETDGMFQGDIVPEVRSRFRVKHEKRTWKDGIVYYKIDPELASYRFTIERAMKTIQSVSCVQFKEYQEPYWPWEKKHHHLKIINETGCWSIIGSTGRGSQELSLGPGCRWHGTVLHELMHALGFGHMHCNRNRDKYIRIHWDNIEEEKVHNFELLDPYWYEVSIFDYSSIMLYGSRSFSKDGSITMEHPLGGRLSEPYEKGRLSNNDIYYLNKLYNCPVNERVPLETPRTEYRG